MKTFDRYVVRSFLISAVLCFLVLIGIRILVHLSAYMDEFAEKATGEEAKGAKTVLRHITAYYACQSLVYWRELSGVIVVTAACFTLAWMNHTNELTAVLASGVSLRRVLLPVVLVAIALNLLVIVDTELLIPPVKHRLVRSPDEVTGSQEFQVRLIADRSDSIWYSRSFLPAEEVLERPLIVLRDEDLALAGHVTGASARYDDRYGGWWILSDPQAPHRRDARMHLVGAPAAYTTTFVPSRVVPRSGTPLSPVVAIHKEEHLVIRARDYEPPPPGQPNRAVFLHARFNFLTRHGLPTVSIFADRATYSGRSLGWTLEGGRMMCLTDLDPKAMALRRSSDAARFMSTAELNDLLKLPRIPDPAGVRRTRHARFADFFNNIIMLLVAVPFILSRERNIKASALMALVSVAVVYVCIYVFRHLQIHPILAAWAPILIFGPVSAVTVDAIKT